MDEFPPVRKGQLVFQALLLVGSLVLFWEAFKIEGIGSISGSGIFPMAAALVLVVSLIVRLVADFRQMRRQGTPESEGAGGNFFADVLPLPILAFILVCVLYVAAMGQFGFWIPTGVFLAVTFAWLYTRNPLKVALITGGAIAFIYLVFAFVFKVYLP
jgi:hypothetical protein